MKRIHEIFEDEQFKKLEDVKDRAGMGWREFICEAARAYEREQKRKLKNPA